MRLQSARGNMDDSPIPQLCGWAYFGKQIEMKHVLAVTLAVIVFFLSGCGGGSSDTPASNAPTALQIVDNTVGTGATASAGNTVTVNYTGWLYDASAANFRGKQFDSSVGKSPFTFKLGVGQVIQGWDLGVAGMKVGGTRTLIIPSVLGYGSAGAGGVIPGNAGLVFSVDLLAVQ